MMKTPNSKSTLLWKKLAIIPLMGGLFFLFADRVEAQTKKKKPVIKEVVINSEATSAQMEKYRYLLKTSEEKKMYKMRDIEEMIAIYNTMSKEQKATVKDIRELIPPPPPPLERKVISESKFRDFKNASKYAVWIDGVSTNNRVLEKHEADDFVSYQESFVHKNARSKKYPQEYQVNLYTEKYFEKLAYQERKVLKEVKVSKKDLPPPPPRQKKKKKKDLPPPPPKPVKIEVVEKETKSDWDTVEERIKNPKKFEKIEVIEEVEVKEKEEVDEKEEVEEVIEILKEVQEEKEIEIRERIHEKHERTKEIYEKEHEIEDHVHKDHLKETYQEMVQQKAKFYLNGKKTSAKKVKKYFFDQKDKLQTIDIVKDKKNKFTVKLTAK